MVRIKCFLGRAVLHSYLPEPGSPMRPPGGAGGLLALAVGLVWKQAGVSRATFEALVLGLPDGFIDHCHMEADAEKLVESIFGKLE